jgi:hypothetical protein
MCLALAILYVKAAIERNSLRAKNERLCSDIASEIRDNTFLDNELANAKEERQLMDDRYFKLMGYKDSLSDQLNETIALYISLYGKNRGLETSVSQLRIKLNRLEKLRRWPDGKFKKFMPAMEDSDAD